MAGARARKLDLSGFLSGNSQVASIIANTDQSGGIGGLLGGVASGIKQAGINAREDKRMAVAASERTYQHGQDAFRNALALKAEGRAASDQTMQEETHSWAAQDRAGAGVETSSLLDAAANATGSFPSFDTWVAKYCPT